MHHVCFIQLSRQEKCRKFVGYSTTKILKLEFGSSPKRERNFKTNRFHLPKFNPPTLNIYEFLDVSFFTA